MNENATLFLWAAGLSVVGFLGFLLVDVGWIYSRGRWRALVWTIASLAQAGGLGVVILSNREAVLSSSWWWAGALLALFGAGFTLYTVFVEIPLLQRLEQVSLVRTGTYAICRHPAFWGILMFVTGMSLLVPVPPMWGLSLLWVGLELALVVVQDVWLFPARFPQYMQYQQETPFLIPTGRSLQRGWESYRRLFRTLRGHGRQDSC